MPISDSMKLKTRRQSGNDAFDMKVREFSTIRRETKYRVVSKFDGVVLPTLVTLEEFTASYGAAARGYYLEKTNG